MPCYSEGDIAYCHTQILENCLWLFGREVRVITFRQSNMFQAVVFWKTHSLNELSTVEGNLKKETLFTGTSTSSIGYAVRDLLSKIQYRISSILQDDPDEQGQFLINKSEIPDQPKDLINRERLTSLTEAPPQPPLDPVPRDIASPDPPQDTVGNNSIEPGGVTHQQQSPDIPVEPAIPVRREEKTRDDHPRSESTRPIMFGGGSGHGTSGTVEDYTPSSSTTSHTVTNTGPESEEFLEWNRKFIRDEVNLAVKRLLGGLADQIGS